MVKRKREVPLDDRPPPPPSPPLELIRLLQSNEEVLHYFSLLQANLDYDKQKWKNRASSLKRECEDLRKKVAMKATNRKYKSPKQQAKPAKNIPERYAAPKTSEKMTSHIAQVKKTNSQKSHSQNDVSNMPRRQEEESEKQQVEGEPINDAMFDFSSDNSSIRSKHEVLSQAVSHEEFLSVHSSQPDAFDHVQSSFRTRLAEAHKNLGCLGVCLVENEKRRCDTDVVADLLYTIRTVSRIQLLKGNTISTPTAAFINFVPACNCREHPAFQVKQYIYAAFDVMENYCINMDRKEWKKLAGPISTDEDDAVISTGMYNRQALVRTLMDSLNAEISYCWATVDRSARIVSTALHYEVSEDESDSEQLVTEDFSAKSQARLSNIVERVMLTQILTRYLNQSGSSRELFDLFCRYIVGTMPSLHAENYPKYPPVLSLCIVEALLAKDVGGINTWLGNNSEHIDILRYTAIAIHATAIIWRKRLCSRDDRITDIARVELESYNRILKLKLTWLGEPLSSFQEIISNCNVKTKGMGAFSMAFVSIVTKEKGDFGGFGNRGIMSIEQYLDRACALSIASQQIEIRKINYYRKVIGILDDMHDDSFLEQSEFLDRLKAELQCIDLGSDQFWIFISTYLKCCLFLCNGWHAEKIAKNLADLLFETEHHELSSPAFSSLMEVARTPVVRVINLKRRIDRRNAFQSQAKIERILVVYGVARLNANENEDDYFWGNFAFDGKSSNTGEIQDCHVVAAHWRPSDLKAFDQHAWDNGLKVKMSKSERACAFSHVASWQGARRSLEIPIEEPSRLPSGSPYIQRLFRISGFAKGKALLTSNANMPPSPVCLIMEDDAILVDRFTDRLEEVLTELPRDFHFCSLGYSRPKSAPIVPWSSQLGIPTCIWYLTGYLISLDGAKYLLKKLPVQGPVDSWIGLQMCGNWENKYGQSIGVGIGKRPKGDITMPRQEELELIIKFRAFCALTPLCSQKVGTEPGLGRSWRHRDTDIEYSGSVKTID